MSSNTFSSFIKLIFSFWSAGAIIEFVIFDGLHRSFGWKDYDTIFWISYAAFLSIIFLISINVDKLKFFTKKMKDRSSKCRHDVRGGNTGTCLECKKEHEERKQREIEKLRKKELVLRTQKHRNSEIQRVCNAQMREKEGILCLSPFEFEDAIAALYLELGFEVEQTPYINDGGKDIIAQKDGKKILIECKRYRSDLKISRPMLQKLVAAMYEENAEEGIFITTSDFASTCEEYAQKFNVKLISFDKLLLLTRQIYKETDKIVSLMCKECGELVNFSLDNCEMLSYCKNNHQVNYDLPNKVLSSRLPTDKKYCSICDEEMYKMIKYDKNIWKCRTCGVSIRESRTYSDVDIQEKINVFFKTDKPMDP